MMGTCRGSTSEVGRLAGGTLLGSSLRRLRDGLRWKERRREVFTEPGPAEQTGREQLVLSPVAVFAACPHGRLNKRLI